MTIYELTDALSAMNNRDEVYVFKGRDFYKVEGVGLKDGRVVLTTSLVKGVKDEGIPAKKKRKRRVKK